MSRKKITPKDTETAIEPVTQVDDTVSLKNVTAEDDKINDSFYKGSGGCYTLDEQGRIVPATDQGDK